MWKVKKMSVVPRALIIVMALALVMALTAPVAQAATPEEIEDAIEDGLTWLAGEQNADGSWGAWEQVALTGLAVLKFETHAIFMGMSPFDPAYTYHENVENGLDYIFDNAQEALSPLISPHGNPDPDGDGGIYFTTDGHETYNTGIALMAIAASDAPSRVVNVTGSVVDGWTYEEVAQDIVDYLAWGQNDAGNEEGGWGYWENDVGWSDNSNSGYATLGLGYAEAPAPWGFGLAIPAFVFSELNIWIDYIQNQPGPGDDGLESDPDGGSGYYSPDYWVNILKTGNLLQQMCLVGDTTTTPRVQDAVDYMERHWNDPNQDPGWKGDTTPNYQACFTTMKGFQCLGIEIIDVGGPLNWYDDMADAIVTTQNADGSWPGDSWGDSQLTTCWAMLTLEKAAPPQLALLPPFDTNPPGTDHTVTAVYKIAGVPQVGVEIQFEVIAGPNAGDAGSDVTDANGEATFTYTGDGGTGTDTIEATAVDPAGAPLISSQATKVWEAPPQVPSMTWWGIAAAAIILGLLIPLGLRRRRLLASRSR